MSEDLKLFNTVLVASKEKGGEDPTQELEDLMNSEAFEAILGCIDHYSVRSGLSKQEAMKEIIHTFRSLDSLWSEFIFNEGLNRICGMLDMKSLEQESKEESSSESELFGKRVNF
jgi:hypothetical protein